MPATVASPSAATRATADALARGTATTLRAAMSRREQITMTEPEVAALLVEERTVICATNGHDDWPHLMPLWFVVRDGELWSWTYARSQKVSNLERDDRCSLQVEAGDDYQELRGVLIKAHAVIHRDTDVVATLGSEILGRYTPVGDGELTPEVSEMVQRQASKRVGLQFVEQARASWDHRKLAGTY